MRYTAIITLLVGLCAAGRLPAAEPDAGELRLSQGLRSFLQSEMRDIADSMQAITTALATADWKTVETRAAKIRDAYLAHQKLPPAEREELESALPAGFHALDGAFHERADRLAAAASLRDAELSAFHFYRLAESCIACHSQYARQRFPGFETAGKDRHRH